MPVRITDYCDQSRLSTRERLELFVQVCDAIQHAHQKGIIHRDIKLTQGTGVRLALVRKSVERMQGRLWVESTPGIGSKFWLEFLASSKTALIEE